jgi:hypothetical protein
MKQKYVFEDRVEILVEDGDTVEKEAVVAWISGQAVWRAPFAADVVRNGSIVELQERAAFSHTGVFVQCHVCKEWHKLEPDEVQMYINQEHDGVPWTCPECQQ